MASGPLESTSGSVRVDSVVAGYRVLGVLGVGGSGTVYRAENLTARASGSPRQGEIVALKTMNVEHAGNDSERQRFAREAELVRRLAHPHVVGLLDYGFVGGFDRFGAELPYLVFPFLEGRTLEARVAAEGPMDPRLVGRFAEQALSALEVAHGMGIAHRDLKPANLFCVAGARGEEVRILDFGTAKIVGEKSLSDEVTRAGMLVGTPRYMAPEQARGEPLTPAADVYAFGLLMAEMLLGRPFVTGATDFEIYVAQGSDQPHELPDEILASPFASVIARAIAKPVDVRYRLASQMLADVRAILARMDRPAPRMEALDADMEATQFLGEAPVALPASESAQKLRTAFNAIARKNTPAPAPAASGAAPAHRTQAQTRPMPPAPPQPIMSPAPPPPMMPPPAAAPPPMPPAPHVPSVVVMPVIAAPAPHAGPAPAIELAERRPPPRPFPVGAVIAIAVAALLGAVGAYLVFARG